MKSKRGLTYPVQLLEPQSIAFTDTASAILDTQNFGSAEIQVHYGTMASVATGEKVIAVLQESDSLAAVGFAAVAAADIDGAFTMVDATSKDSCIQRVAYRGGKRYVRVNLDFTGSAITGPVSVVGILGQPSVAPIAAQTAKAAT